MYVCTELFLGDKKKFYWSRDFWEPFENFKISKLCLNLESRDHDKFSKLFYNNNKWNPKILFMKKKISFFEKLTIFFPFFCPFFPFGGGYSTSLTLHLIELVMTFRMIGHMTNNQIYFYTKKHFEIMYYRFLQFLACIHRNGDIRLILCDNTFWLFRPNLGSWVQKLKHFFFSDNVSTV